MRSKRVVAGAVGAAMIAAGAVVAMPAVPVGAVTVEVADEAGLRAALTGASNSEPNVISLAADITIAGATDPLYVSTQPLTVEGNGHTLDGAGNSRVLQIGGGSAADLTVRDLVARNGRADDDDGGAIKVNGDLTIVDSAFFDSSSPDDGGAVHANGTLTISGSTFSGNSASSSGGAASSNAGMTITNSTVTGNATGIAGGAVFSRGEMRLTYVTVAGNATEEDSANVRTFDDLVTVGSVIVDPQGGPSCQVNGVVSSEGFNYADDTSCGLVAPTDTQDGADPLLGALADNGGPTPTRLPAAGSPLVDAIPAGDCVPGVTTDQRGLSRPADGDADGTPACDIGAVEVGGGTPATTTTTAPPPAGGPTTTSTPTTAPAPGPAAPATTAAATAATAVVARATFTG